MQLNGYVETLRAQLALAAAAGGDDAVEMAERLTGPLDAAARLVIQEALSDAAQEITRELAPGAVELRLRGRDLAFVVTGAPGTDQAPVPPAVDIRGGSETSAEGATSRITFRPPDHLKARIEDAAEREGLSVNTFLVRTLAAALDGGWTASPAVERLGTNRVDGWFR